MSAGRPGGLTAMAVMNFMFGGYGLLSVLGLGAMVGVYYAAGETNEEFEKAAAMVRQIGVPALVATLSLLTLAAVIEILAGFGYLRQKRILGRWFGNAFALLAIAAQVLFVVASHGVDGMGFTLGALLGVLYPLLTLILVNTTFREDLVN
jgi:hypothetical protein